MIQIISGEKGKGKTKILLAKVNEDVLEVKGNIVYLDKSNKHMYELSNKVRLVNVEDYLIENSDEFAGFICGIISEDHDLETIYVDSFLKVACVDENKIGKVLDKLTKISEQFNVHFVISISLSKENIPAEYQSSLIVSL
ncbi:twitching motility protein PilT [Anaeromicropila populeti]|uniref:Twitching motility protein PilT n=1 Tax=Anaeromicropila populeti TaxID=37658 RepID=A0A1I6L8B1_9FIRM|nr:twitching motility protein PilT [Anaeromicropila populeti]SFR99652.1 hypothetical protein SAMN05661086_03138 [Anaeromicropila populeti]